MAFVYVSQTATNGYGVGLDSRSAATAANKLTPLLTLVSALSKVTSGDTIVCNDGTYTNASFYNVAIPCIITGENDHLAIFQAANVARAFFIQLAGAGTTFGNITIDNQFSSDYCIQASTANIDGLTIDGTKMIDPVKSFYYGAATNVEIKNYTFVQTSPTSEINGMVDFFPDGAGTISIHDGAVTTTGGDYSGATKEFVRVYPTISGVTYSQYNNTINVAGTSGDVMYCFIGSGCDEYDIHDNIHAITGFTIVAGVRIDNHATITCNKAHVYNNTGDCGDSTGGYLVRIGDETNTNRDNIDNARIYNNDMSGNDHGYMFGWITGANGWGNKATDVTIGFLQKGTTDCEFSGNVTVDIRVGGQAFRYKGATNCKYGNNINIQTISGQVYTELANVDSDSATDTTGCIFNNNIGYDITGLSEILASADVGAVDTVWANCDYYTTSAHATPFNIGATTYATVALFNGAGTVSGCLSFDPLIPNYAIGDYAPSESSQMINAGVKWWGTDARPEGYDEEPFPDYDLDIGAIQSTYGDFHPVNL